MCVAVHILRAHNPPKCKTSTTIRIRRPLQALGLGGRSLPCVMDEYARNLVGLRCIVTSHFESLVTYLVIVLGA